MPPPNKAWIHNQMGGHVRMMERQLRNIIDHQSVTLRAKVLADEMLRRIPELQEELKTRI